MDIDPTVWDPSHYGCGCHTVTPCGVVFPMNASFSACDRAQSQRKLSTPQISSVPRPKAASYGESGVRAIRALNTDLISKAKWRGYCGSILPLAVFLVGTLLGKGSNLGDGRLR